MNREISRCGRVDRRFTVGQMKLNSFPADLLPLGATAWTIFVDLVRLSNESFIHYRTSVLSILNYLQVQHPQL